MTAIRIAIHGAGGRMGRRLVALTVADPELKLAAALESPAHPELGEDAGQLAAVGRLGIPLSATLTAEVDALIDFSLPEATEAVLQTCLDGRIPLVFATTGLSDEREAKLTAAAEVIPVLRSPNMSMAVNLTMKLAAVAARALKDQDADVEILERHHRFKEDAPSGTALKFGQIISGLMGQASHRHGRQGRIGARPHGEIGYHAIRAGDDAGGHTIVFAMLGEAIELSVRATSRDCYALGALAAAKFLAGKQPGLYGMEDVLGI
ncbi:MAG: 4-hydroxy-tetrahydrodipicolinate reductase [Pirellulales bacterium]|jgi:4-hydroxy-tetrahydrodipicolinate reductase|nr:4-hydroxy-tetrahydrodipicolinate reductase [Thermoguttaceae bacterium]MDD4786614.1 4-hydroxy-tetrahydrodipicolinate reductase [Pirellulales bacterium]MDI9443560.1 4-hydroxy-tetrahydrodipicolinate reductase [Planctomycetota bacterium]NLZ03375.1 4-hydroxy-tetrahydrodipicolinate reductase [Pirellulaceae bacterium]